jgi:DNA (cytosine-5)-methyltransferase 1
VPAHRAPFTVLDLFSGSGGMSWGFWRRPDAFRLIGAVDLQKGKPGLGKSNGTRLHCNKTYCRNLGIEPVEADLATLEPADYRAGLGVPRGSLTVLISCAPCTGFSQKKASNHLEDDPQNMLVERSALWVKEFEPRFFVMENVKELVTGNQRQHYRNLVRELERLDYGVTAGVFDLSLYGLPQTRTRAIILAEAGNVPPQPLRPQGQVRTVREAIGHLPPIAAGETWTNDPMHTCPRHTSVTIDRMRAIPKDGGSWADIPESLSHLLIPSMRHRRSGSFPDIYGRLWWNRPSITITRECAHPGNGRYTHPEQDRMLSVREMSLLQGFPEDYYFDGPLTAKYNQIGDAVPPSISGQVAETVLGLLEGRRESEGQLQFGREMLPSQG